MGEREPDEGSQLGQPYLGGIQRTTRTKYNTVHRPGWISSAIIGTFPGSRCRLIVLRNDASSRTRIETPAEAVAEMHHIIVDICLTFGEEPYQASFFMPCINTSRKFSLKTYFLRMSCSRHEVSGEGPLATMMCACQHKQ